MLFTHSYNAKMNLAMKKKCVVFENTSLQTFELNNIILTVQFACLLFDCHISYDSIACDAHYIARGLF